MFKKMRLLFVSILVVGSFKCSIRIMEYLTQSMVFGPKTGMSLPNVTVENADMLNVDTAFGVGTKSTESAFANSFVGNIRKAGSDWSTLPDTEIC